MYGLATTKRNAPLIKKQPFPFTLSRMHHHICIVLVRGSVKTSETIWRADSGTKMVTEMEIGMYSKACVSGKQRVSGNSIGPLMRARDESAIFHSFDHNLSPRT